MSESSDSIMLEATANDATPDENKVELVPSPDENADSASNDTSTNTEEAVEAAQAHEEAPPAVDGTKNLTESDNTDDVPAPGLPEAQIRNLETAAVLQHPTEGEMLLQANHQDSPKEGEMLLQANQASHKEGGMLLQANQASPKEGEMLLQANQASPKEGEMLLQANHQDAPKEGGAAPPKALSNEEVMEHTASLWKYLPIPADEPEAEPEYINSTHCFPGSKIIAARVRGKKHKHEGTNCDDWYEVANYERITLVAVSDGAGSKKFSRIGAKASCKAAVGYLVSSFEKLFAEQPEFQDSLTLPLSEPKCEEACRVLANAVQQAAIKAHEAVEAAYYSRKTNPEYEKVLGRGLQFKDLSGTLLIAVMIPVNESSKEKLVISCQIGDGMIVVLDSEGEFSKSIKLMSAPDCGDFSGETDFLTSSQMKNLEALGHRTKISRTSADTLMLMSDGVSDDYFPNETEMRRLYFDLIVNGILDTEKELPSLSSLTQENMKLIKRIPDPLVYPWVNDQSVKVPIQYTKRIAEALEMTLEDIWRDRSVLKLARLELADAMKEEDPSERLKVWLDNYVERGSFDDRTLVVVTM